MKTFNAFEHEEKGMAVIKVGFSWHAFIFTPFWLLMKKLWGMAVLYFVVLVIAIYFSLFPNNSYSLISGYLSIFLFSFHFVSGFKGNKWRKLYLENHGYIMINGEKAKSEIVAISHLCNLSSQINQPLRSYEYGKLVFALVLLAFSVFFVFGIPAAIFIVLGFIMMKIKQDFSYVDNAVRYCRVYIISGVLGCTLLLTFVTAMSVYEYITGLDIISKASDMVLISLLGYLCAFIYSEALYELFYITLITHKEWVVKDAIIVK